ncbi:CopD family protein [Mycolicibacterium sphagni]|uniref:CopD family protein n=1 Tax=Mycolicibacterium sphagni TaxID=1786 RepID=UPI0021F33F70|nr:CopD family protein [Mycolicibacterium sphagni]MCV7177754.1 CopD family protein [Mycolicibacterium sphagni]
MPGATPPTPAAIAVVTAVVYYLSVSLPLGIGMAVGALAIPESRGGLVSRGTRSLALPAAVIVVLAIVLQFHAAARVTAMTVVEYAALALSACGLVAMRWTHSRILASGVAIIAILAAVIPNIPLTPIAPNRMATTILTTTHLLAAMTWAGGLLILGTTAIVLRRNVSQVFDDDRVATDWAQIWERFSLVALVAVGALIVSGTWLAWNHVGTPSQFFTTSYGRFLGVKLILVLALLSAGAYNVRVLLPRIRVLKRDGDQRGLFHLAAQHFPAVVLGEGLLAIGVLTVVPFLRGSARTEAGWPSAGPFDMSTFATGLALIAFVAVAMWAGTRRSVRPLRPSRPAL